MSILCSRTHSAARETTRVFGRHDLLKQQPIETAGRHSSPYVDPQTLRSHHSEVPSPARQHRWQCLLPRRGLTAQPRVASGVSAPWVNDRERQSTLKGSNNSGGHRNALWNRRCETLSGFVGKLEDQPPRVRPLHGLHGRPWSMLCNPFGVRAVIHLTNPVATWSDRRSISPHSWSIVPRDVLSAQ